MTPKTLWISLYGMLLISCAIGSRKKLRRKKVPPQIREWRTTSDVNKQKKRFASQKTTPMFVHRRRSYSDVGFENVSTTGTFIDKTMMLEIFFETHPYNIVTFPPKFGKTINLDMIYRFVGIELMKTGRPLAKKFTSSYSLFVSQTEIGKQRKDIIQNHFAEYPVLYLNMVGFFMGLRESNERMDSMSHILKWCIAEYEPLLDSELLRRNQTHAENFAFIRKAIDKELSYVDMMDSLYEFSRILHNHFNEKVVLLIDDFDCPFDSAVSKGFGYEMIELLVIMLDRMFHPFDDECHVGYALITGVSNTMATLISTKVPEIMHHRAFENHVFAPFYGITDEELAQLMYNPKLTYDDRQRIPQYYSGYLIHDTNQLILNTFSVTEHIKEGTWHNPWYSSQSIYTFVEFPKNKQIYEYMLQLLYLNVIKIQLLPCIGLEDLNNLRKIEQTQNDPCDFDPRVLFSFFFEYGYLSFTERDNWYRVPNAEISDGFKYFMMEFYDSTIHQKTDIQNWDKEHAFRETFETGNVTDEMLSNLQNALKNLIRRSENFNVTRNLKLLHYQALIDYNARKDLRNVRIISLFYDESVEQPIYIVMINLQTIMTLFIGLTENEPAENTIQHLHQCAIPYETNSSVKMVKYIGINFNQDEDADVPKIAYNCRGSINAENYHVLLTSNASSTTTKRRRRNYTRSTTPTYASFPKMPKQMRELLMFDGRPPPKRANTAIEDLY